jgi:hypothetical protein
MGPPWAATLGGERGSSCMVCRTAAANARDWLGCPLASSAERHEWPQQGHHRPLIGGRHGKKGLCPEDLPRISLLRMVAWCRVKGTRPASAANGTNRPVSSRCSQNALLNAPVSSVVQRPIIVVVSPVTLCKSDSLNMSQPSRTLRACLCLLSRAPVSPHPPSARKRSAAPRCAVSAGEWAEAALR